MVGGPSASWLVLDQVAANLQSTLPGTHHPDSLTRLPLDADAVPVQDTLACFQNSARFRMARPKRRSKSIDVFTPPGE